MTTRQPFQDLPEGCPPVEFDTDIVPEGFLLCDIDLPELPTTHFQPPTGGPGNQGADGCPACEDAVATDTDGSVSVDLTCGCWDAGETVAVYTATASATATLSGGSQVSPKLCRYELAFETEPPPGLSGAVTVCKGRAPRDGVDGEDGEDGEDGCPACETVNAVTTVPVTPETRVLLRCDCWEDGDLVMVMTDQDCHNASMANKIVDELTGKCEFVLNWQGDTPAWADGAGAQTVTICRGRCAEAGNDGCPACEDSYATLIQSGDFTVDLRCDCWDDGDQVMVVDPVGCTDASLELVGAAGGDKCTYKLVFQGAVPNIGGTSVTICHGVCQPGPKGDTGYPGCPACEAISITIAADGEATGSMPCECWDNGDHVMVLFTDGGAAPRPCCVSAVLSDKGASSGTDCSFKFTFKQVGRLNGVAGAVSVIVCPGNCCCDDMDSMFGLVYRVDGVGFDIDLSGAQTEGGIARGGDRADVGAGSGMSVAAHLATPATFAASVFIWLESHSTGGVTICSGSSADEPPVTDFPVIDDGSIDIVPLWRVYMTERGGAWRVLPQTTDMRPSRILLPARDNKLQYMPLQLQDPNKKPVWDWLRWHT